MEDRIGQRLGNYRLIRLLGRGGFAEVYLGEHLRLGTYAAVKVLYTRLASADEVESFQKEARTIAHLEHPHIVRVFDFDVVNGTPFLVMSYAAGGTLRKRYPEGAALPLPTIITYVKQVADALQYAHDQRLVHRDIKPENMLVGGRDEVLLSDFGIAIIAQSSRYQGAQDMAGTIAYMAPEQIQAHPRPASDQYSLAVVVYEWLSGDRPFHGSYSEIAVKHTIVPPPPLREKNPVISPEVEAVVMLALGKDPHQRFSSVQAFAHALERASQQAFPRTLRAIPFPGSSSSPLHQTDAATSLTLHIHSANVNTSPNPLLQPSEVVTPSGSTIEPTIEAKHPFTQTLGVVPTTQIVPQPTKHLFSRRAVIASVAGLAAVGIAGGGITWAIRALKSPVSTPSGGQTSLPPGTLLYTYRGHTDGVNAVAWSPDGKYIASGSNDKTVQVWDAVTGSLKTNYQEDAFVVEIVSWSPNGKYIASQSYNFTMTIHTTILHVMDIVSGNHKIDYQGAGFFAWSPDGSSIALISNLDKVEVWDVTNGNLKMALKGNSTQVYSVAWSPDGKHIAAGGYGGIVEVWDVAGNLLISNKGGLSSVECLSWSPGSKYIAWGNFDGNVEVWNATTGSLQMNYTVDAFPVTSVDWSSDGKYIALHADFDTTQVLDAATGKLKIDYKGNPVPVTSVAWSPDSKHIASRSDLDTVEVWDATTGSLVTNYKGHSGEITSVAWSPDGRRIASGSADHTVQVWQAG